VYRCAGCEALLQNLESQVTSANSRKDKESKIVQHMEQEVCLTNFYSSLTLGAAGLLI